jgi:hypothetical protein
MKFGVPAVRYGIPAVLVLAGFVCLFVAPGNQAAEGWALFTGAGIAVLIVSLLMRIGMDSGRDRDREEEAREYFKEHGRWPDE